ncbi:MAG: thiol oxidoreductase [Mesorhizobium amorphae]|nr:MAG: thiol oxidoreductase [Mesorhizobium amorphae]
MTIAAWDGIAGRIGRRPATAAFLPVLAAVGLALLPQANAGGQGLPQARDDLDAARLARVQAVTEPTGDFTKAEPFENLPGGAATTKKRVNADIFSQFSANLSFEQEADFKLGNALFRKNWVSSPSSTQASDGLGPLFNARACQSCHIKDGRGHPPEGGADSTSMLFRLARTPETDDERARLLDKRQLVLPDPTYGAQLQELAVPGLAGEGRITITYTEVPVTLGDGTVVSLRKPAYEPHDLGYGPLFPTTTISPRIAPPMIGLGLVEQIHPAEILALADPDDADGDGISGRASVVHHPRTGVPMLGRFGWKASAPTIRQQSAEAFAIDMGLSTPDVPLHTGDCSPRQMECLALPNGVQKRLGDTEAPDPVLELVTFYSQNLAVPARRKAGSANVLEGKQAFYAAGCASCHTPKFVTRADAPDKALAFQLIWPYSDFLLHDMGEGLADGQPVGDAGGNEWRTPPLWGIGLTETVNGHTFFLHDGRARNLEEAILWHGGEAEAARDRYAGLPRNEREALIRFLESL